MSPLRSPRIDELSAISDLCIRSKAYWGYDDAFMEACRSELTWVPSDLTDGRAAVASDDGGLRAVAQVTVSGDVADLERLFVDPAAMGDGLGRRMFEWAVSVARAEGATRMTIEADPDAAPFYKRMGAVEVGTAPSGSIPGRRLPLLEYPL